MLSLPLFLLVPAYLAAASPIAPQGQAPQPRTPNVAVIPLTNPVYHRFNARAGKTKSFNAAAALQEKEAVKKKHGKYHSKRGLAQKQNENDGATRKGKDTVKNDAAQKGNDDRKGNDRQKEKDNTKANNAQKGNQDTKKGKDDSKNNAAQKGQDDTRTGQKGKDDNGKNSSAQKGQQDDKSGATKQGKDDSKNDAAQKGQDDTRTGQKGKDDNGKNSSAQKGQQDDKSGATKQGKDDSKTKAAQKGQNGADRKTKGTRSAFAAPEPFDIKDLRRSGHFEKRQNSSGNAPLTNDQAKDYAYYGPVSVGTPAQNTTVLFDTGSSDLILPLSACTTCVGPLFASNRSSTFHDTHFYFDIEYLDGSGSRGTVAYDTVSVAGLSVKNQSFGAILMESNSQGLPSAGIMGMGFPPNAQTREPPFFFNLANGSLASNAFSFFLSRDEINGSEVAVAWHPLEVNVTNGTSYWWNIAGDGISVNGSEPTGRFEAIIDSGTSLIYVPPTVAADLYRAIPDSQEDVNDFGTGFYTFPCDNALSLPPISLVFGGVKYEVNPTDFNLGAVDIFGTRCVGGIVGLDVGLHVPAAIIGVEFMKAWYSVFDLEGMRVGFAPTFGP
ncbi:Type I transmembrane sorting receptor [Tulasnella sp. 424]|nr:Type I transmembrane sorting receptor [Tulasnella sp. 424]